MNLLIMGRAKTGTTVISKTIEKSLKGSSHYSLEPKTIDFFYEKNHFPKCDHQVVKIIYEHWNATPRFRNGLLHNESPIKFDKIVLIVRDPRDELISRLLYIIKPWMDANGLDIAKNQKWIDLLKRKEENPQEISFLDLARQFDQIYSASITKQIMNAGELQKYFDFLKGMSAQCCLLKYEDFMVGKLDKLSSYLKLELSECRDVGDLSRTRRSASYNNWKSFLTPEDVDVLKPAYEDVLSSMGYVDWDLETEVELNSKNYSDYITRLAAEHAA